VLVVDFLYAVSKRPYMVFNLEELKKWQYLGSRQQLHKFKCQVLK